MSSASSYCPSCKSKTGSVNPHQMVAKNGRPYVLAQCQACGKKKSCFVAGGGKGKTGSGAFGNMLGSALGGLLPF